MPVLEKLLASSVARAESTPGKSGTRKLEIHMDGQGVKLGPTALVSELTGRNSVPQWPDNFLDN
jgi:hypothetical protein